MNDETIAAVSQSIEEVRSAHPDLYRILKALAEVFEVSEIDPKSELAEPASALVAAFNG